MPDEETAAERKARVLARMAGLQVDEPQKAAPPAKPALPPAKIARSGPLKILFLHGNGGCIDFVPMMTAPMAKGLGGAAIDAVQGFMQMDKKMIETTKGLSNDLREMGLAGDIDLYTWYEFTPTTVEGPPGITVEHNLPKDLAVVDACVDKICAHIVKKGGVDGIVGFSQGGSVAMALCDSRVAALNAQCARKLSFLGVFGGTLVRYVSLQEAGRSNPFEIVPANIEPGACGLAQPLRVFFCSGTEDDNSKPSHLEVLRNAWASAGATVEVTSWKGGHRMPTDNDPCYRVMNEFI